MVDDSFVRFIRVDRQRHANQGSGYSNLPGYDVWLIEGGDQTFLGFCLEEDLDYHVKCHQDEGERVQIVG